MTQRKKTGAKAKEPVDQGVAHYKFKLLHEIEAIQGEGAFQVCKSRPTLY